MTDLIEIDASQHRELKIADGASVAYAASQHLMNIRVTEIDKATSCFPIFFTRNPHSGGWAISAMTSFTPGSNLFVAEQQWDAIYTPVSVQTYPLSLVRSQINPKGYAVALDPVSDAFSLKDGESLFEANGKASLHLARISALLESDARDELLTRQFVLEMQALGFIKPVNVVVRYKDGGIETIKGLHTADEDKLNAIGKERLQDLCSRGYLVPIYAMLLSIYQLNALIKRHNSSANNSAIDKINVEVSRPVN